jgi:hypothetical protein
MELELKQRFTILILLAFLMFGCNPVKQVLKSKERTERVVRQYVKENPPTNDTIFIPGEVVRLDTTIYDTVPLPYPVNHRYTEKHYIKEHSRDTLKIVDKTFEQLLNNRLTKLETEFEAMKTERNHWRSEARFRLWLLIGLIAVIVAGGVVYLVKVLKPTVTLMK